MKISFFRFAVIALLMAGPYSGLSQRQSTISGHLFGNDGKPMLAAHVLLTGGLGHAAIPGSEIFDDKDYLQVQVEPDGSFSLSTDSTGALYLIFTSVGHKTMQIPLIIEHPVNLRIDAHLEVLHLVDNFEGVEVRYNFDEEKNGQIAPMKQIAPRIYKVEVSTNKSEFKYRFCNIGGSPWGVSILGTAADSFEYTLGDTYTSIIRPRDGKVSIILTDTMPRPIPRPEGIVFSDSRCVQARFFGIHQQFEKSKIEYDSAMHNHLLAGKPYHTFIYDWAKLFHSLKSQFAQEKEPIIRQEILLQCIEMASLTPKNIDSLFIRRNICSVPPGSLAWVYHGSTALNAKSFHSEGDKYVQQILEKHPSRSFRAMLISLLCTSAMMEKRQSEYARLFYKLTTEFLNTPAGRFASSGPKPHRSLSVGMKIPAFAFTSIDDPKVKCTNADIKGKYVLIDFWATWCAPCVEEMKFLQNAYDKFHDSNFEILSVTLRDTPERIRYFRSKHWVMPWLNGYVKEDEDAAVCLVFDAGTPKPILINPNGIVIAIDGSLRGERLESTLLNYLGKRK
ncbi:MAG: redoxin domain-containing protein [Bacteroidota bacterium]